MAYTANKFTETTVSLTDPLSVQHLEAPFDTEKRGVKKMLDEHRFILVRAFIKPDIQMMYEDWQHGRRRPDGKLIKMYSKVPVDPVTLNKVQGGCSNKDIQMSYEEVLAAYWKAIDNGAKASEIGIGIVMNPKSKLLVVDIDDCRDPVTGELKKNLVGVHASSFVHDNSTLIMVSSSGTGMHVFMEGKALCQLPNGTDGLEVFGGQDIPPVFSGEKPSITKGGFVLLGGVVNDCDIGAPDKVVKQLRDRDRRKKAEPSPSRGEANLPTALPTPYIERSKSPSSNLNAHVFASKENVEALVYGLPWTVEWDEKANHYCAGMEGRSNRVVLHWAHDNSDGGLIIGKTGATPINAVAALVDDPVFKTFQDEINHRYDDFVLAGGKSTDPQVHRHSVDLICEAFGLAPSTFGFGKKEPNGQKELAEYMADRLRDAHRYCPETGWHYWGGSSWGLDKDGARIMQAIGNSLKGLAGNEHKQQRSYGTHNFINAVKKLSETERGFIVDLDDWDKHNHLLPCKNITVNLQTGERTPPNPDHLFTWHAPHEPVAAPTDTFDKVVSDATAGNVGLREYVVKVLAVGLHGGNPFQEAYFFKGRGGTGKSAVLLVPEIVLHGMGGFGLMDSNSLMAGADKKHDEQYIPMFNNRVVSVSELSSSRSWSDEKFQQFTGDKSAIFRGMHVEGLMRETKATLYFGTNQMPAVRTLNTTAMRRRVRIIPFNNVIPDGERDSKLFEKLKAEAPAILDLLIKEHVNLGGKAPTPPAVVTDEVEDYLELSDPIARFAVANIEVTSAPNDFLIKDDLVEIVNGHSPSPRSISRQQLDIFADNAGWKSGRKRRAGGGNKSTALAAYIGVRLVLEDFDVSQDETDEAA